jgi:hypothetical protein
MIFDTALLQVVHSENTLVSLVTEEVWEPVHFSRERVVLGSAAHALRARYAMLRRIVVYHGTTYSTAQKIVTDGFLRTSDGTSEPAVFVKDKKMSNYALEHGTDGAVIECDLYLARGGYHRRNANSHTILVTRPSLLIPRRVLRVASVDDMAPPPLMRARRH